ncbi:Gfo/Idh/MocA family oxidoreductase [Paenibacillus sp. JX-17]|uniref:Gfo/Idh/MocA family oxidoreductase n=1 Tax=Paenibacillus lacisoli TaxID=3064525 RepID=A0ABT9CE89_9BACL|nr:Gfo/Idh/MocA family oxidoreductase [Paenibacillus sp. JX-17]MDO7907593.1 Gfo/Idh/MocA family oxidoreductase [Paenibacillus sp. JX-17]
MNPFRIGLIGLGGMAQAHIRWMLEEDSFQFAAVSDVHGEAMAQAGDRLGIPESKRYADFQALIEDPDVDAVVSVTPNNVHANIISCCLQAGKPFLSEKPFTLNFEEAIPLLELYEKRPVPAMLGFSYRYTPAFRYARQLVKSGRLGTVRHFSIQYLQGFGVPSRQVPYMWRYNKAITGTGALGDLGSHMIDMARFLFGEFEEVSAQLQTIVPERRDPVTGAMAAIEVDDFASFQARMTDDIMGVFQTSRNAFGSGNQHEVSIYSDLGAVHATTLDPDRLVWIREEEAGQISRVTLEVPQESKVKQYADFAAVLRGTSPDGVPGFMDGYRNQEVLDAIVRANETKTVIRL